MVPTATADAGCSTTSDSSRPDNAESGPTGAHPPTGRVAYLRERYRDQELSEEATSISPGGLKPTDLMTHSLASGIAGVVRGIQIPFQVL